MVLRKCCVGGCTSTSEIHRLFLIPKNDNLQALWLSFIVPTNPLLTGLTKSQLINKRVCSKHFDKQQFDGEGQRLRYSYPCLLSNLEIALGEPRSAVEWNMLNEHNYFQKESEIQILEPVVNIENAADSLLEPPSCSFTNNLEVEQFSDTNYGIESTVEFKTSGQDPQSSMKTTAEFVEFVDNLFDSVNGYPGGNKRGKLRKAVKWQ